MPIYIFAISTGLTFAFVLHKLIENHFSKTSFLTKIIRSADGVVISLRDKIKNKFKNSYSTLKRFIFRTGPKIGLEVGESMLVFLENFGRNMSTRVRGAKELVKEEGNGHNFIKAIVRESDLDKESSSDGKNTAEEDVGNSSNNSL